MTDIINAVTENWELIVGGIFGALAIAKLAVKFTKTKKDDAVVAEIEDAIEEALGKAEK